MNLNRCTLNPGESMFARRHTQHPALLLLLVLSLCQLSKNQTLVHVDILPHDNIGFWGKLYNIPFIRLWKMVPGNTSPERLFVMVPGPFPDIIPLIPYPGVGSLGNAGDISPGRQCSNFGQCGIFLQVPEQITHSLPLFCTTWESLAGWDWCHKYLGRLQYLHLTLAGGELNMPPKCLLPQLRRAQKLNLLSCYVEWEWRSQNMFY